MNFVIYPPSNSIAFEIFNLSIRWYGLILAFSIFIGATLGYFLFLKKEGKDAAELFSDSIFYVVVSSIIGARIFYVIGDLDFYFKHPKEIIMINHGGLSIYGAIIFGILTLIIYLSSKKVSIYRYLDVFALVMPLCQAIGRWGNYFNQEAFGRPCTSFLRLFVDDTRRPLAYLDYEYFHPTFLYESVLNFILFCILLFLFFKKDLKAGIIFSLYLIFYSIIRIVVESYRIDSIMDINSIPIATILSIVILLFGLFNLFFVLKKAS